MSHPKRSEELKTLISRIESLERPYSFEGFNFVIDTDNNVWHTLRSALKFNSETHKLIIEDDVFLSDDFFLIVDKAINLAPKNPINFFSIDDDMLSAFMNGFDFIASNAMRNLVAFVIPTFFINDLINFNDRVFLEDYKLTDARVSVFTDENNITNLSVVPSVVEHLGTESLIGTKGIRKASIFRNVSVDSILNNNKIFYKKKIQKFAFSKFLKNG